MRTDPGAGAAAAAVTTCDSSGRSCGWRESRSTACWLPDRDVIRELAETGGDALMSPPDLKAILRELISSSVDATFAGGRITIRVRGTP